MARQAACVGPGAVRRVADVGCGTGRYAMPLAAAFDAHVCALDPSVRMLAAAIAATHDPLVPYCLARAECLPLRDGAADLVWLSQVYHHLADKAAACDEFRRVVRPGGHLAVRTSVREQLDAYLWVCFFPEARAIDAARLPSANDLTALPPAHGLRLVAHETVRQVSADDHADCAERIGQRALSALQMISDAAFQRGMTALRAYCAAQSDTGPVYEDLSLLVYAAAGVGRGHRAPMIARLQSPSR
ncbi:MAG: class I SAM-dependent methyltransferase [Chloroflexota bacterium]